jgi:hypothetical protein
MSSSGAQDSLIVWSQAATRQQASLRLRLPSGELVTAFPIANHGIRTVTVHASPEERSPADVGRNPHAFS